MADDRRIITGTYVVAKEGNDLESGTKYIIDSTIGSSLGGKSIVTTVDANQWHATDWYKSESAVLEGMTQLSTDTDGVAFLYIKNLDTAAAVFVTLGVEQTWDGTWSSNNNWDDSTYTDRDPNYDGWWDEGCHIKIPPGGSIQLRGDGSNGLIKEVYARPAVGTVSVNIEYVVAQ